VNVLAPDTATTVAPAQNSIYLDHASMGPPLPTTLAAVADFVAAMARPHGTGTERTLKMFAAVGRARREVARLVHSDPGSILLVENTSRGLGQVAEAPPLSRGDNVLVDDLEFMSAVLR
jgi:selenocysteine lyase/cysteine desulfurase